MPDPSPKAPGSGSTLASVTSLDQFGQAGGTPRPQSLMLSFFGIHALGREVAVSAGSLIDVFGQAGITEEAVRSTLTRMVKRGLLERHRRGRKTYFGPTPRAGGVLQDGHDRIWRTGAVNRDWDGTWTLVGFSLPEAWRRERHDLRSRLVWNGAAALSSGGFVAPVLGGITGNYGSWRWAFIVVTGLAVISTVLSQLLAHNSSAPEGRSLDLAGPDRHRCRHVRPAVRGDPGPGGRLDGDTGGHRLRHRGGLHRSVHRGRTARRFAAAAPRAVQEPGVRRGVVRRGGRHVQLLGTAYATGIRLGPIQHQSPLRGSFAFILLNAWALLLMPVISRLLEKVSPRWVLGAGLALMATGDFIAATLPVDDRALTSLILPIGLVGIGFALTVSSITATAVNTVEVHYAGMASASTSLLRDFGFTLGPAVIGAIALSRAADEFTQKLGASDLSAQVKAAAGQVAAEGGPLAANSVPPSSPPGGAAPIAMEALGNGYAVGYVVCGIAALACCLLSVIALRGKGDEAATVGITKAEEVAAV